MNKIFKTAALFSCLAFASSADAFQLSPHKDDLFGYPRIISQSKDGAYKLVEYNRDRDMIKRDKIPRRKAHFRYVDEGVRWYRKVRKYKSPNGTLKYFAVGKKMKGAAVTVIYVHGKGGNRRQGVNDWTFGGNFNRLQNLMVKNNGLLMTPDFSGFKSKGTTDITALVDKARRASPNTKLIVACGSMGGGVCWRLANNPATAFQIDGLFILGSHWNEDFLTSSTLKKPTHSLPIYFGHGASDPVFSPKTQKAMFDKIRKINPNYPVRFVMFETGAHGTPIRMVDWRREINWMLSVGRR